MNFETILTAALNSKPSEEQLAEWAKREADGEKIQSYDWKHRDLNRSALTGWGGRTLDPENVQFAAEYAEPGYTNPESGILFANWNACSRRVMDLLEQAGYECEWEDEWTTCGECGKALRTSPDSYSWLPSYVDYECEYICHDCIDPESYLESIEDNPRKAVTPDIDPTEYGYILLDDSFENGFHPGQNDDPAKISKELHAKGYKRLLFKIDGKGQFDISFSVYHKPEGEEEEEDSI
jgi:hypothetical protein